MAPGSWELVFHTKVPPCCPHQAHPPSTPLRTSKTSTAAVLDPWTRACWGRAKALALSVQANHEQAGQTVLLFITYSCPVLHWRQQYLQDLQGSMLTTFKLSPDLARCFSREQANNQATAAYGGACQGLPAAAWSCKYDFGWPCADRKEFAFCIHLLALSSPQQWGRSLNLDSVKQIPTNYTILLSCGLGMDMHSSMKIIDTA